MQDYWHKQSADKPLYPDMLWSRPENRNQAGKLLVVGGNAQGFAAAGEAYNQALKAGIGSARVLLPDSLQKSVGLVLPDGEYAPSTPSGSFSRRALAEILAISNWADATLLAGDLGRNSETAIMLEQYINKYVGQLTITKDAADYFLKSPLGVLNRRETLLVVSFAQLQKLAVQARFPAAFTFEMSLLNLIETLHEFTTQHNAYIITRHLDNYLVAVNGLISTTKVNAEDRVWRVKTSAAASVWWLQNPAKPFEALTTSLPV